MTIEGKFRPELLWLLLRDLAGQESCAEIPVRGTSMCPTLLPGDRVRLVPVAAAQVRIGDVLIRMGRAGPIIHRLVGWWPTRDGWRMLTMGDSARQLDPPLGTDDLTGRVLARVRGGEVQRLDGTRMRVRGYCRAVASLGVGVTAEVWNRGRRVARGWARWRED